MREEEGIPALVATLRGSNERVRLMAVKALHNVLCGCVPYANHEALLATPNALVLLMKLVLTSQDGRVVTYLLKLLGLLLQYGEASWALVRLVCAISFLPRLLARCLCFCLYLSRFLSLSLCLYVGHACLLWHFLSLGLSDSLLLSSPLCHLLFCHFGMRP